MILKVPVICGDHGHQVLFTDADEQEETQGIIVLLRDIAGFISANWPTIEKAIVLSMKSYEQVNHFGKSGFKIGLMKSGGWIDDDFMLEFFFNEAVSGPVWVVAFKNGAVIHTQASF